MVEDKTYGTYLYNCIDNIFKFNCGNQSFPTLPMPREKEIMLKWH